MDKANSVITILSSGFLMLLITHMVGFFSKKSSVKIKHSKIKVALYSPVIQFMNSVDFKKHSVAEVINYIEINLYKKYDYVYPNVIYQLMKIKAKKAKGEIHKLSTKDFRTLYIIMHTEYNLAKKGASMPYDTKYTNMDANIYKRYIYTDWPLCCSEFRYLYLWPFIRNADIRTN